MHLYSFWPRFYTNALFDLCTNPFISSYVASPLIQAREPEQLGTTVPDLFAQAVLFVPSALLLVLEGKIESDGERGVTVIPVSEKGRTDSGAQWFYSTPFSYRCCLNIYAPTFSSNQLCFVAIACKMRSVTTNHCSSTSKYIPQEMHQLDVLNNSLPKSQCLWTY